MDIDPASIDETDQQLEAFRKQWLAEVTSKRTKPQDPQVADAKTDQVPAKHKHVFDEEPPRRIRGMGLTGLLTRDSTPKELRPAEPAEPKIVDRKDDLKKALTLYEEGTQYERTGNIAKALEFYQKAFKLDQDVDRNWRKVWQTGGLDAIKPPSKDKEEPDFAMHFMPSNPVMPDLQNLAESFAEMSLVYPQKKQNKPVLLEKLPNEIVMDILGELACMDVYSLMDAGLVCRKMYLLTREQSVWRKLCENVYLNHHEEYAMARPVVPLQLDVQTYGDWKRMYLGKPRLRFDGLYISRIHYWRPGGRGAETSMYQPFMLVTYFRYCRFFPDGTVMTLCTSTEPMDFIKQLKTGTKIKGMMTGHWLLTGARLDMTLKDYDRPKTTFNMHFTVHSPRVGTWNQLKWVTYTCNNGPGSEVTEFPMRDLKPFYFSRVRSWA